MCFGTESEEIEVVLKKKAEYAKKISTYENWNKVTVQKAVEDVKTKIIAGELKVKQTYFTKEDQE